MPGYNKHGRDALHPYRYTEKKRVVSPRGTKFMMSNSIKHASASTSRSHQQANASANDASLVDYVLVYKADDPSLQTLRDMFEESMKHDGLYIDQELVGKLAFVKIHCPFDRICIEADRVRLEMPLKGCEIERLPWSFGRSLMKFVITDDESDFVSAPFEAEKFHLYDGSDEPETFFRSSTRTFLTYNILINLDINDKLKGHEEITETHSDNLKKRGLLYLLMKKAYIDSYALHDPSALDPYHIRLKYSDPDEFKQKVSEWKGDDRKDLENTWTKSFKFQPLWKIRNYYGEKIALYFAWVGTFITVLWVPSLIGLGVFIFGLITSLENFEGHACAQSNVTNTTSPSISTISVDCGTGRAMEEWTENILGIIRQSFDNICSAFFAMVICLWGTLFLEIWKRTRYTLAYQWDCDSYEHAEPDRPEFFGTVQEADPITGELSWVYPQWRRVRKFFASFCVVMTAVTVVFISVAAVLLYKVFMRIQFGCVPNQEGGLQAGNPITCVIFTTMIPSFLNASSIMLLGRLYEYFAQKLTEWENHQSQTQFNDSLIIKLFAFQFANTYASLFYIAFFRPVNHGFQSNGLFGLGMEYQDTCTRGSCMSLLSFQVLVLMLVKPLPKFFKDIILPYFKKMWRKMKYNKMKASVQIKETLNTNKDKSPLTAATANSQRGGRRGRSNSHDSAHSRASIFSEDSISPEPTNRCEATSNRIERDYLKPSCGDFTLSEYTEKVIQFGYILMFAASFPLAPLLTLLINLIDMRIDARRLLWWNRRPISFLATDIGMWLPILQFVTYCGVVSNALIVAYTSSFCDIFFKGKCTNNRRLLIVIIFEHVAIVLMYIIRAAIPDVPAGVVLAQRRERYQVTKILEEGEVPINSRKKLEEQQRQRREQQKQREHQRTGGTEATKRTITTTSSHHNSQRDHSPSLPNSVHSEESDRRGHARSHRSPSKSRKHRKRSRKSHKRSHSNQAFQN